MKVYKLGVKTVTEGHCARLEAILSEMAFAVRTSRCAIVTSKPARQF